VGVGDYGIHAVGETAGGYFEDGNSSGWAKAGNGDAGIVAAGLYAGGSFGDDDSGVWGDVAHGPASTSGNGAKNFVQNHPTDPDRVIVYAALEGDEVGTYTRGTGRLVGGEARVALGETFKWVTNPDVGLTAYVTPRGQAIPLAIVSLTTEELVVRGPTGTSPDVVFDYVVYGLRIGFDEISVVREKEREAYIPSMADQRRLYERRPDLERFNPLERFKAMREAIGKTEPLDLTASQALHDAVVEFDPAVHSTGKPEDPLPAEPHGEPSAQRSRLQDSATLLAGGEPEPGFEEPLLKTERRLPDSPRFDGGGASDTRNGNVVLDEAGEAWVEVPESFAEGKREFRYQLTGIGSPAVIYIGQEIIGNRFKIAGGDPGMKVSWQVVGVQ